MNNEPIISLKGIGEKTAGLFARIGVETVEDLLHNYPRAYDEYTPPVSAGEVKEGAVTAVIGRLTQTASVKRIPGGEVVTLQLRDTAGVLQLVWFHMPYLRQTLQVGRIFVFRGKVVKKNQRLTMEQPEVFTQEEYGKRMHSLQPVYSQTKGLGNRTIVRAVAQALAARQMEREYMPDDLRRKYELAEYNYAVEHIHFPTDRQELLFARKRLVFDEFFFFLLAVRSLKERRGEGDSSFVMKRGPQVERLRRTLPFCLTKAQERVLGEVLGDLESGRAMNRLIQGDVGSGKTILAVFALLEAVDNGYQGALMAPTEVLAKQHFETVSRLFETCGIVCSVVLVTGSMTAKEKREAYRQIESHEADLIIGTHALIQEKVRYDRLALVITDEQHRFGVGQREALGVKGAGSTHGKDGEAAGGMPHVLVMSATPIPRTLAIILYGDLDISIIDEVPANRLPVRNCVVDTGYRENAYRFIAREVAAGHQAYVICPMVEESEMIEAENVLDYTGRLRRELPSSVRVESLHGRMKGKEKNAVMERFASGEIQVLVSTTVVEVGVNVPNATVMMIENAERFGLAQLHQLRGRVGRGRSQSYCIMVDGSGEDGVRERLDILNRSNDGFYIASEDLKLRGPGDIFGVRQSGELEFRLADVFTDADLLKIVSGEVNLLLQQDPMLDAPGHQELKRRMERYQAEHSERMNL